MYFERRVLSSRTFAGVEAGSGLAPRRLGLVTGAASMLNDVEHGRSDVTAHRLLRRSGRGLNGTSTSACVDEESKCAQCAELEQ